MNHFIKNNRNFNYNEPKQIPDKDYDVEVFLEKGDTDHLQSHEILNENSNTG